MTTVREGIARRAQHNADTATFGAIAEAQQKIADEVRDGTSKMKGLKEYGDWEVVDAEVKTGRSGVQYHRLVTIRAVVLFFPNAKYGAFLTVEE